jgi:hypothetical protein
MSFLTVSLPQYFKDTILSLDVSSLPPVLQERVEELLEKGSEYAPEVFDLALEYVFNKEVSYFPPDALEEMDSIAEGICSYQNSQNKQCDIHKWRGKIRRINMLPELIRMSCTALGAYSSATKTGDLIQLRALDFGGGPFANNTVLTVHRSGDVNAYVTVGFPSFVGVITGVSESGVGVSEKVWMTYDTPSIQPGSYDGIPDVLALRDVLAKTGGREEAEGYLEDLNRTWSIWIGIGDYDTQKFDLVGYKQDSVTVYDDETIGKETGQEYIEDVCYVDKHPQPSKANDLTEIIKSKHGEIDFEAVQDIVLGHDTGDLHWAAYDFGKKEMVLAIGRTNEEGEYGVDGEWNACRRPAIKFKLEDLWNGL